MAKIELVKFRDGKYGVRRRGWFVEEFFDLRNTGFWWGIDRPHFPDCRGSEDEARAALHRLTDYGQPVHEETT